MFESVWKMLAFAWFLSFQEPNINYSAKKAKCKVHTCFYQTPPCGVTITIHRRKAISPVMDSLVAFNSN